MLLNVWFTEYFSLKNSINYNFITDWKKLIRLKIFFNTVTIVKISSRTSKIVFLRFIVLVQLLCVLASALDMRCYWFLLYSDFGILGVRLWPKILSRIVVSRARTWLYLQVSLLWRCCQKTMTSKTLQTG